MNDGGSRRSGSTATTGARTHSRIWVSRLQALALFLSLGLAAMPGIAQINVERLADFTDTVWSTTAGIPTPLGAMAQTPDGWIWLSSKNRLYRFDGVTAVRLDMDSSDSTSIDVIHATQSGDLWLGYASGLMLKLPAGDLRHALRFPGIVGQVKMILEDKQGNIWVVSPEALFRLQRSTWKRMGSEAGLVGDVVAAAAVDTEGTLWAVTDRGTFRLDAGQQQFRIAAGHLDDRSRSLYERLTGDRSFEANGAFYLSALLTLNGRHKFSPTPTASTTITDHRGALWTSTADGLFKTKQSVTPQLASQLIKGPLDAPDTSTGSWERIKDSRTRGYLMEDVQRNIWVGAVGGPGMERFRPSIINKLNVPSGIFAYTMLPGFDGTLWFGNAIGYKQFGWWHVTKGVEAAKGYDADTTAAYRDADGSVILGTGFGTLLRFDGQGFSPIRNVPPVAEHGEDVVAIARDGQQNLWVGFQGRGIYELKDGRWLENGGLPQLPANGILRAIRDSRGRLWLSYPRALFIIDKDKATRYDDGVGMSITNVRDIIPDGVPVIGGDTGVATFDGQHFHLITAIDPSPLSGVTGLVRLADGTLWLNGNEGAVRIAAEELTRSMRDSTYRVRLRVFGIDEGMPGTVQPNRPLPTLVQGTDGRLWFATQNGIGWLDPNKVSLAFQRPTLLISSISSDGRSFPADLLPSLPAGTRSLQINYTAIGLSDPMKTQFRYRLIGVDKEWQEVGTRRQAFYTNLGPGTYRFRISAASEDGAWTDAQSDLRISISPYFYQTSGFWFLCMGIAIWLLWLAYRYRIRHITGQLHQRLDERLAERDRIARELHDTYLQTVQSLVLKVHAASVDLPDGNLRNSIHGALQWADRAITEGRDRVRALRTSAGSAVTLSRAFEAISGEFDGQKVPALSVKATGESRSIDPLVADELYASGREAIVNACRHSAARTVTVGVTFDREGATVVVSDDGKGIDPKVIADGGIAGHWGMRGMCERMERVGGRCRIISQDTGGTRVVLAVGASKAYVH